MTLIVAYAPDERGKTALHLASMLARSIGDELVICSVIPAPWVPGMARIDAEYRKELDEIADQALELARKNLPGDVSARFERHSARSAPAGLLELAKQYDGYMIVVGTSSAGVFGHISLGSVTNRLLHSSPVAIALAPRGFRSQPGAKVKRVTAAYDGSASAGSLLLAAAGWRHGSALRYGSRRSRCGRAPHIRPGSAPTPRTWCCRSGSLTSRRAWTPHSSRSRSWRRCHGKWRPWSDTARAGRRRSTTSAGTTTTCWWSARASRPDRAGVSRVQGGQNPAQLTRSGGGSAARAGGRIR